MQNIAGKNIIPVYGKLLRNVPGNSIAELDKAINPGINFQVQSINEMINEFNGTMPPNRMSHYILAFISSGSGKKTIGSYSFNIQPNMIMIFPKRVIHSSHNWSLNTSGYMLTFNESVFEEAQFPLSFLKLNQLFKITSTPYQPISLSDAQVVGNLFAQISNYKNGNAITDKKIFILKLSELILLYQKLFETGNAPVNKTNIIFDRFAELVENSFREKKEVKFYADALFIHPHHLNRLILSHTSFSAKTVYPAKGNG